MLNFLAVALVLVGSFIGAIGTLLIKKGTGKHSLQKFLFSSQLWIGLVLYAISVIFYVLALWGEELSIIYPLVSTTYIWTTLFSVKSLAEKMNKWKWLALMGIILGIVLIGLGS